MAENVVLSTLKNAVRKIVLNRPNKKNAINKKVYIKVAQILNDDATNDNVVVTIITGQGDFYSSGNDFSTALSQTEEEDPFYYTKKFIEAFINYPKILIAVVNGPAIGIAATTAALCDAVYCSDKAYFHTPFIQLGLCAEGGSSYTYPRILGRSKASELLLLGEKLYPSEAYQFGFVSKVIPHSNIDGFIESLYKYGTLPVNGVKITKKLILANLETRLIETNAREIGGLNTCIQSEDSQLRILNLLTKNKL